MVLRDEHDGNRFVIVQHNYVRREHTTTKSKKSRRVDLSRELRGPGPHISAPPEGSLPPSSRFCELAGGPPITHANLTYTKMWVPHSSASFAEGGRRGCERHALEGASTSAASPMAYRDPGRLQQTMVSQNHALQPAPANPADRLPKIAPYIMLFPKILSSPAEPPIPRNHLIPLQK